MTEEKIGPLFKLFNFIKSTPLDELGPHSKAAAAELVPFAMEFMEAGKPVQALLDHLSVTELLPIDEVGKALGALGSQPIRVAEAAESLQQILSEAKAIQATVALQKGPRVSQSTSNDQLGQQFARSMAKWLSRHLITLRFAYSVSAALTASQQSQQEQLSAYEQRLDSLKSEIQASEQRQADATKAAIQAADQNRISITFQASFRRQALSFSLLSVVSAFFSVGLTAFLICDLQSRFQKILALGNLIEANPFQFTMLLATRTTEVVVWLGAIGFSATLTINFLRSAISAWHRAGLLDSIASISKEVGDPVVRNHLLTRAGDQVFLPISKEGYYEAELPTTRKSVQEVIDAANEGRQRFS